MSSVWGSGTVVRLQKSMSEGVGGECYCGQCWKVQSAILLFVLKGDF